MSKNISRTFKGWSGGGNDAMRWASWSPTAGGAIVKAPDDVVDYIVENKIEDHAISLDEARAARDNPTLEDKEPSTFDW